MRIGVLVGRREDGGFDYLGTPGQIDALDQLQRDITDAGGEYKGARYVKTWRTDASSPPCKSKKCGPQTAAPSKAKPKTKPKK